MRYKPSLALPHSGNLNRLRRALDEAGQAFGTRVGRESSAELGQDNSFGTDSLTYIAIRAFRSKACVFLNSRKKEAVKITYDA